MRQLYSRLCTFCTKVHKTKSALSDCNATHVPRRMQHVMSNSPHELTKQRRSSLILSQNRLKSNLVSNKQDEVRKNSVNIQMLSQSLYEQVFKTKPDSEHNVISADDIISHLSKFELWGKETTINDDVDVKLPRLQGKDISEHFYKIGFEQTEEFMSRAGDFIAQAIPEKPQKWNFKPGWTRYNKDGSMSLVPHPDEEIMVFDVEVLVPEGNFPTMATALTPNHWYSWCSERLVSERYRWVKDTSLSDLIPLETANNQTVPPSGEWKSRLVIGHNVGYDRSFVKEQYFIKGPKTRFLDTMSLHIAVSGFTSLQRILKAGIAKESQRKEVKAAELRNKSIKDAQWLLEGSMNNLSDVYALHCKEGALDKETRNIFVTGNMKDIRDNFQMLMNYCASDTHATYKVFKGLWPDFRERFPHPVTLAGMLEMGSAYLPLNYSWQKYTTESEATYVDLQRQLRLMLMKIADDACLMIEDEQYKEDVWMWDADWSVKRAKMKIKPKLSAKRQREELKKLEEAGDSEEERVKRVLETASRLPKNISHKPNFPIWYADLCPRLKDDDWSPGPTKISTQTRITPKLLQLTWEGFPLHYDDDLGWGYLVPAPPLGEYGTPEDHQEQEFNVLIDESDAGPKFPIEALKAMCDSLMPEKESFPPAGPDPRLLLNEDIHMDDVNKCMRIYWQNKKKPKKDKIKKTDANLSVPTYHKGIGPYTQVIPGVHFFKLPHKDGDNNNVGNPLAKDFLAKLEDGTLSTVAGGEAFRALELSKMCSYWRNSRKRILSQMTIWMKESELSSNIVKSRDYDVNGMYGAIVPRIVTAGTVTRRAVEPTWLTASNAYTDRVGSELKAAVQAPPGYHFVGADVDSQELWIAAIMGDSYFARQHGSTAFGWMTLQGNKTEGTDLHSKTAAMMGISRDQAKVVNYARIYGAGRLFAQRLLRRLNHQLTEDEVRGKVNFMFNSTKGRIKFKYDDKEKEFYKREKSWEGGSESHMFNKLEMIAESDQPATPVLGCRISRTLEPSAVDTDFMTSRVNWVVQSSAVDYLHLMLVSMRWLFQQFNIDGRFCISIHDEVRYLVKSEDRYRAALALQITNLWTRSMFAHSLGMSDLPQSVAFFSAVDIDKCLRKEVHQDCKTPSNPHGLEQGYGLPSGEALDIYKILKLTNSSLTKSRQPNKSDLKAKCAGLKTQDRVLEAKDHDLEINDDEFDTKSGDFETKDGGTEPNKGDEETRNDNIVDLNQDISEIFEELESQVR
ncbi:unnamed protein product [Owenia fusiformis]|uniref:DNA-directed DNA polymerase n=1 Tax=Owenia fusiformis TaxID=6347 RepID=A0A8J1XVC9_OWEFU|nr:unnamed protein product [Owenia fusiformis]